MLFGDEPMNDEHHIEEPEDDERVLRLSKEPPLDTASEDDVVREYEARYTAVDVDEKPKRGARHKPRSYSTLHVTDEERLWAALAHGSVWLTLVSALLTDGFIIPASIFVPLVIYFFFRQKSDYVAFHALQAFVLQIVGTVGALTLLVVGSIVWAIGMVIAILAIVVLIGLILVPVWGLVGVALLLAVFLMPLLMLLFGTIAAIETYRNRDYRYPFIARWIDRQMAGDFLNLF